MNNESRHTPRILVIDDDDNIRQCVEIYMKDDGYDVSGASRGDYGLTLAMKLRPDIIITDLQMPGLSGFDLLRHIKEKSPVIQVIVMTAHGSVENAVRVMKDGAAHYLTKPFTREELQLIVKQTLSSQKLQLENTWLREKLKEHSAFSSLIGESPNWTRVLEDVRLSGESEAFILITGESGTGKELIARAIHEISSRRDHPFVTVNCAAIPRDLLESELFGHVKGAFTGAHTDKIGKFEQANKGTLFLDEIGDLDLSLQPKLLRVIQEQEVERVGEGKPRKIDVRIVSATNMDLEAEMMRGRFREDLFFRLSVISHRLPPLRERLEDIPLLINHFTRKLAPNVTLQFSTDAYHALMNHQWKGNIRELMNLVQRLSILVRNREIVPEDLPGFQRNYLPKNLVNLPDDGCDLNMIVKESIVLALEKTGGNQSRAARLLHIPRHTLIYRMKQLGINSSP